jgi:anaerobic selenocysteine-containing dehydrogenase
METLTACTMNCPDACSLLVGRDAAGRWKIRGNPDHPVTSGFTCRKIRRHIARLASPERIMTPLLRTKGGWQPLTWDAALDKCAENIERLRSTPHSILHIPGDGAKGVLKQIVRLFFARLGSTAVHGSLCDEAGIEAGRLDFGSRRNHRLEDLGHADRIVNWGRDLARSTPHLAAMVVRARSRGATVLTISPGGDDTARFSDEVLTLRPGTDRFLALAVIRHLLAGHGPDQRIIERIGDWPAFRELVERQDDAALQNACGLTSTHVEQVAAWYSADRPTATLIGAGLQRYRFGGETVRFIDALALLGGHIGRPGGGSYFHLDSLERLNLDWARPAAGPARRSLPIADIGAQIAAAAEPRIEMIWVNGTNIVNQAPQSRQIARAFAQVPFKVVVDAFFNDTVQHADLVLPTTLMLEQEDLIGSYLHDFVHYVRAIIEPPKEARPDTWIARQLGRRLHPAIEIPDDELCLEASLRSPDLDTTLAEIRARGFVRLRQPEVVYGGMCFDHADGLARLPGALHAEAPGPDGFPLRLLSLVRGDAMHSQMAPQEQPAPPTVWVAPDHPALERLGADRTAYLVSPLARLKVTLAALPGLHPEALIYRRGDWMALGGGVNQLIAGGVGDLGDNWACYDQYVRIENRSTGSPGEGA